MKKCGLLILMMIVSVSLFADYGIIDGSKLMYNYYLDFIADSTLGTNNYGRIDGQMAFQNSFITWIQWADTVGSTTGFPVDFIDSRDSTEITIQDDVVMDSNLTVTGNLTVSGSGLQDSIYTSAIEAVTAYISTNNTWWKAKNFAGTWGNLIKWNASDHIEFGTSVEVGSIEFEEDSGVITGMDMPVSDTPSDGDEESINFSIDSNPVLRVGALADGAGGIDSAFVKIYGKLVLDSLAADPDSVKGTIWYGGGDDSLHIWTGAGKQTFQLNMAD